MQNPCMELHFLENESMVNRNNFLLGLYTYAINNKSSRYIELGFYKNVFDKIDK